MKTIHAQCHRCQKPTAITSKQKADTFKRSGRTFCSDACRDATVREESSARMAKTNTRFASARMKARNPMRIRAARERMAATLQAMGWTPTKRGGNGKPLPLPQQALALALAWPTEVPIATGLRGKTPDRYPTCYKLDIANTDLKIGIEVDGNSHATRRALDAKKDRFFNGLGWTILRFTNQAVTANLAACVAEVLSTISKSKTSTRSS